MWQARPLSGWRSDRRLLLLSRRGILHANWRWNQDILDLLGAITETSYTWSSPVLFSDCSRRVGEKGAWRATPSWKCLPLGRLADISRERWFRNGVGGEPHRACSTTLLSTLKTRGSLCGVPAVVRQVICQHVDAWTMAMDQSGTDHPINRAPASSWECLGDHSNLLGMTNGHTVGSISQTEEFLLQKVR